MPLEMLFGTDIGLLSLFTILFVIGMGGFIWHFVRKNMREEEQRMSQQ